MVQGSNAKESTTNGKDSDGKYAWMDVIVERDGNWVAVRFQSAQLK